MRITKAHKKEMLSILAEVYADTATALRHESPFELLIAVILSAQCTDARVNITTTRLFPRYDAPAKLLELGEAGLAELIRDCGLFHTKAKNIIATCALLCSDYGGNVPDSFDELVKLPGVGRKTANVVLSQAFDVPAIAVDTHVFRVANRLQLAVGDTPRAVEEGLMQAIPRADWSKAHHWLIWHGRRICKARQPDCGQCPLAALCPSARPR
jgi:endonuclease III